MPPNSRTSRSFVVSSAHDPASLAILAQHYEAKGLKLDGSYNALLSAVVDETLIAHNLDPKPVSQDQSIAALTSMGFSVKQLDSDRGKRRAARHSRLEDIASMRESEKAIPEALQHKLDGGDMSPWTEGELAQLVALNIVSEDEVKNLKKGE